MRFLSALSCVRWDGVFDFSRRRGRGAVEFADRRAGDALGSAQRHVRAVGGATSSSAREGIRESKTSCHRSDGARSERVIVYGQSPDRGMHPAIAGCPAAGRRHLYLRIQVTGISIQRDDRAVGHELRHALKWPSSGGPRQNQPHPHVRTDRTIAAGAHHTTPSPRRITAVRSANWQGEKSITNTKALEGFASGTQTLKLRRFSRTGRRKPPTRSLAAQRSPSARVAHSRPVASPPYSFWQKFSNHGTLAKPGFAQSRFVDSDRGGSFGTMIIPLRLYSVDVRYDRVRIEKSRTPSACASLLSTIDPVEHDIAAADEGMEPVVTFLSYTKRQAKSPVIWAPPLVLELPKIEAVISPDFQGQTLRQDRSVIRQEYAPCPV